MKHSPLFLGQVHKFYAHAILWEQSYNYGYKNLGRNCATLGGKNLDLKTGRIRGRMIQNVARKEKLCYL